MPDTYEFAEPANDCFIPRHGDFTRSTALLKAAAAWYNGAKVTPADRKPEARIVAKWTSEMTEPMKRAIQEIKLRYPRPGDLGPS